MDTSPISPSKPKKRRYTLWLLLLLALLIGVGYTTKRFFAAHTPLSNANKILASVPWGVPDSNGVYENYHLYTWQDNETIIYGLCDMKDNCRLMRQKVRGSSPSAAQPLPNILPLHSLYRLAASPNGKWLLIAALNTGNDFEYTVFALDTGTVKQKYPNTNNIVTWMNDSRSFFSTSYLDASIMQYEVEQHDTKHYRKPPQLRRDRVVSPSGDYFANDDRSSPPMTMRLERGSILTGKSQVWVIPRFGAKEEWDIYSVSPQGDRLLWSQTGEEVSWWDKQTSRLTHRKVEPKEYGRWYVTDMNGGNPKELFMLHYDQSDSHSGEGLEDLPKWLPDGKHLSVIYKGALYVVDAP